MLCLTPQGSLPPSQPTWGPLGGLCSLCTSPESLGRYSLALPPAAPRPSLLTLWALPSLLLTLEAVSRAARPPPPTPTPVWDQVVA